MSTAETTMSDQGIIHTGAKVFVATVFSVLGLSFIATTLVLYAEFADLNWLDLATLYSHLFLFFPSFGIVALCAFYIPASVFADLYWYHIKRGRLRFALGGIVIAAASYLFAHQILSGKVPTIWDLTPETLAADHASPPGCVVPKCRRAAFMDSVLAIRTISQQRIGLSPFARECKPDPYIEPSPELARRRYCFVTKGNTTAPECCVAQELFAADLTAKYEAEPRHSLTGSIHAVTLPLKVFFLFVLLTIGIMLAIWRRTVDRLYAPFANRIERGVLVGALAMLLWPASNHAFLQSASLLYGSSGDSVYASLSPLFSIVFICWALLLLLFFFRRQERDLEAAAKLGGAAASALAVIKYNQIVDFSVRFLNSGANIRELAVLAILVVVAFIALAWGAATPEDTAPERDAVGGGNPAR